MLMGTFFGFEGCSSESRRRPRNVGEIVVFVPGFRIPKPVDFSEQIGDGLSRSLVEHLSALRTRIVVMAGQEAPMCVKPRRKATQHGGFTLADLQQALEDYLPVLMGPVEKGNRLQNKLQFSWVNQEDDAEETRMPNSWYEVLSVLHLMSMLLLSQANSLLLHKTSSDGYQLKSPEDCRRDSIGVFLKAAGYLDFAVHQVIPQIPTELRKDLPLDLAVGVLQALLAGIGPGNTSMKLHGVVIQLGMAIESIKATLAVKRRFACELVKYWNQVQYWNQARENIEHLPLANGWGQKHKLFVEWKYVEAKAAAYYLHSQILEEGQTEESNEMAVAALLAAGEFLKESKKACESFHMTPPFSRSPPLWGTSKYLCDKIPKQVSGRELINHHLHNHEMTLQRAPALPHLELSLKPEEYQLPSVDPPWNDI